MKKELIAYTDPKSPVSEMFKTLRTNIQFMNSNKELKTLLVSSTLPGEGKSWTASNLAVTFAQAGKKVLLIDADMRKGRQFNIFGVSPTPGLSNYLSGILDGSENDVEWGDVIQETKVENLFIITAGSVPPNPSELLVSEKMLELNEDVRHTFDITIFDGTPSLLVTDAPILSRIVDSTIIVTAHNETKIDNAVKVKKAIENVGGKVAGVIVNKVPISAKKYESTYYYGSTTVKKLQPTNQNKRTTKKYDDPIINKSRTKKQPSIYENKTQKESTPKKRNAIMDERLEKTRQRRSWEDEFEEEPISLKRINNKKSKTNTEATIDRTQDILNQMNMYLNVEKNKLKNGDI